MSCQERVRIQPFFLAKGKLVTTAYLAEFLAGDLASYGGCHRQFFQAKLDVL